MDYFPWLLILSISGGGSLLVFLVITFVNWRERKRWHKLIQRQRRHRLPPLMAFVVLLFLPGCDSLTPAERGFLDTTGKRVIGRALDKAFGPEKPVKVERSGK